jgi:transcriptional antiterminator Rof (Rho-off)
MEGQETYNYTIRKNSYYFKCEGRNGNVMKCVRFDEMELEDVYNLALLDFIDGDKWSDKARTSHKNGKAVLQTVASIVEDFLSKHPYFTISFAGNTAVKQRLYNRVITNNIHIFSASYEIYGVIGDVSETFIKNSFYNRFEIKKII